MPSKMIFLSHTFLKLVVLFILFKYLFAHSFNNIVVTYIRKNRNFHAQMYDYGNAMLGNICWYTQNVLKHVSLISACDIASVACYMKYKDTKWHYTFYI